MTTAKAVLHDPSFVNFHSQFGLVLHPIQSLGAVQETVGCDLSRMVCGWSLP